jgi:AcrR family transcriptional regulator
MGIPERRERQKAELRDLILAAAARIIADEGFDALTMRKIAEAIEYSPATLYLHFESRDEIAMQLVRNGFVALVGYLAPAVAVADPLERLRAIGRNYLAFARAEPETYRLMFMENERFASSIMARLKENDADGGDAGSFALLLATVEALVASGTFRALPADLIASLLWAGLHGIASLKISCPTYPFSGDIEQPGEAMIETLVRGFAA